MEKKKTKSPKQKAKKSNSLMESKKVIQLKNMNSSFRDNIQSEIIEEEQLVTPNKPENPDKKIKNLTPTSKSSIFNGIKFSLMGDQISLGSS